MKKKALTTLVAGLAIAAIALFSIAAHRAASLEVQQSRIERGRYMVTVMGCADCHAPKKMGEYGPVPDESRYLSGHPQESQLPPAPGLPDGPWAAVGSWDLTAWSGPWGTSFAMNLTPDENTGIGSWSEETFMKALRTGRHMGVSRPILPPMPWENFRHLSDEDLKAVYAYLMSQPPIRNRIPDPLPPMSSAVTAGS